MYEEYMRDVLGYSPKTYVRQDNYFLGYEDLDEFKYNYDVNNRDINLDVELEKMYPDIYNIIYPMVKKACARNTGSITKESIDEIVEEIYNNIEDNNVMELNINLQNNVRSSKNDENQTNIDKENKEVHESRQRNFLLNDLIRILLLRELLGRPGCIGNQCRPPIRPNRPPMPRPPRIPFTRYNNNEFTQNKYLEF